MPAPPRGIKGFGSYGLTGPARARQLAQVHAQVKGKAVEIEGGAAGKAEFQPPHGRRIKGNPAIKSVLAGQARAAGFRRLIKAVLALAFSTLAFAHDLAEDLLVAEGNDFISRAAHGEVLHQFDFAASFKVRQHTQRGESAGEQLRIRHSVAQAAFKKWR